MTATEIIGSLQNIKYEGGYAMTDDKARESINSHLIDYMQYALQTEDARRAAWLNDAQHYGWGTPSKPLTFWQRMERRWDEVKRRVVNAWAALRGDWERDYDY